MTDRRLQELMRDSVADITTADLAERAWARSRRTARRRQVAAVGGVAAAVVAVGLGARLVGETDVTPTPAGPTGTSSPSSESLLPAPSTAHGTTPDARYRGSPVYWSPTTAEEPRLPRADSPLPPTIDLSHPGPPRRLDHALAAYAVLGEDGGLRRLVVLAPDGSTSTVDASRVQPLTGADGNVALPFGPNMLSPTGRFLMFAQQHSVLVYTLADGRWRALDTGDATTEWARWADDDGIYLAPRADGGRGRVVRVDGSPGGVLDVPAPRGPLTGDATAYGRLRQGPLGTAQSWFAGADFPVPAGSPSPPQVLVPRHRPHTPVLEFTDAGEIRQKACCAVQFWLDQERIAYESADTSTVVAWRVGTHEFTRVTTVTGVEPGQEHVVGSYTRIWDQR